MTPEILRTEALAQISRLVKQGDGAVERDTIFAVIQRDINGFDIETEISPVDLRLLRVQLYCDTLRNFRIASSIIREGGLDEASVLSVVQGRQELLRSVPAYFEVQITETMTQVPSYLPYEKLGVTPLTKGREMTLEQYRSLTGEISALSGDAVVNLSFAGEPAAHSAVYGFVEETLRHEGLDVLLETSGIGWKDDMLESLARLPQNRMTWIVDLDASTKELYESLRGPGWDEAQAFCDRLIGLFPGRVHVQAVRMQENEADLESFYRYWKERASNVIIQKYDWYSGYLPQRKVTDLSPLRRLPCWHLKRDMIILVDGTVAMCREDLERKHILGNVFNEPLADVWSKGESYYRLHVKEDYPEICKGCDEYYTYNF
ncbi:MAG TPA: spiro-SPASM protein, partial [Spirochaetia bacterium]|nr:spiro-SPASM protein [Spirochaetia bacterium]